MNICSTLEVKAKHFKADMEWIFHGLSFHNLCIHMEARCLCQFYFIFDEGFYVFTINHEQQQE